MFWKARKTPRVYADAAAATPMSARALREMERLVPLYGNPGALHKEAREAKDELEAARKSIAKSIGAHADEIIFTASGTEGNNLAIQGAFESGHAITCAIEHQSVLEPLRHAGGVLTEVGVDAHGLVDLKILKEAILPETSFVSIHLVNSEIGAIQPVREIAKVLRKQNKKIYFHTDASQAPLWMDIKVESLGVDLMTLDGQKVLGPKGVGCLYVRRGTPLRPLLRGGMQEKGLRGGTQNVPSVGAFAVALQDAQRGIEPRVARMSAVRELLWNEIKKALPEAILNGPELGTSRAANNLNVSMPGLEAQMAVISMDALGVAVSTRSACTIGSEEPSHVIKALGVAPELAGTAIRITLLPDATESDARRIAAALKETAELYRKE
jgi:cysteine desulfurase